MTIIRPFFVSLGLTAAMASASAWSVGRLGDKPIPTHFGMNGPDAFGPASSAVWHLPALALIMTVLMAGLPAIMPNRGRLERSAGAYVTVWLGVILLLAAIHGVILAVAFGWAVDPVRLVFAFLGVLLAVLGNLMGKVRYNYVFGVRTPWTLSSERVWDRTHRWIGPWFMGWGGAVVLAALLAPAPVRTGVVAGGGLIVGLGSVAYSYWAARQEGEA